MAYRTNSNTYNNVSVRGLTSPGGGGSVVGIYIDDIPVTDSNAGGVSQIVGTLYDVERVEVLKGPQGTLYGEGNMGGAIRFITNKADPNEFDANFRTQLSDAKESGDLTWQANGMLNVPLVQDALALRVSGQYRDRGGFLDTGPDRNEDDVNFIEETALRAKFAWYISDNLTIDATVNYFDVDYGGPNNANIPYGSSDLANAAWENNFENGGNDEQWQYNLSLNWDLDFAHFLSSSSFYDRDVDFAEQTSERFRAQIEAGVVPLLRLPEFAPGVPNPFYNPAFPTAGTAIQATGGHGLFRRRTHRFVQEFRLTSNTEGPWQWTAGAYYKDDTAINGDKNRPLFDTVMNPGFEAFESSINAFFPGSEVDTDNEETAIYGEASYDFNDLWNLLLGVRFSNVTTERQNSTLPDIDDDLFSPKITLTFRPVEDHMLYLTYAQGFRPGVINGDAVTAANNLAPFAAVPGVQDDIDFLNSIATVEGDEVFNLELGYKATVFDGRLRGQFALYYMDWKDVLLNQRISTLLAPVGVNYNQNSGDAHTQGIEAEIDFTITDNLAYHLGFDYNQEAEIESFSAGQFADAAGNPIDILPGNRLANAPKYSFNMALEYDFLVSDQEGSARIDWYRVADSFNRATNEQRTSGYHTVDLRVAIAAPDGKWSVALYGRNLANDEIRFETNEVGSSYGLSRTFGLDFRWNLNAI